MLDVHEHDGARRGLFRPASRDRVHAVCGALVAPSARRRQGNCSRNQRIATTRQPFGLITIASADAAASPHTDAAMLEAHRAVQEVLQRRAMPLLNG